MRELALEIQNLVSEIPDGSLEKLISLLEEEQEPTISYETKTQVQRMLPDRKYQEILEDLFEHMLMLSFVISPQSLALALRVAYYSKQKDAEAEEVELVWTGPKVHDVPLRRTEEVLLDLIDSAQDRIHIVSFATYHVDSIMNALQRAMYRGVKIMLYLETPDSEKINYDTLSAFRSQLKKHIQFYGWPVDRREFSDTGKYGTLHAKLAVVDGKMVLISSANLTEYALRINLEAGVLIRGGAKPAQIEEQLSRLVSEKVFVPISP